MFINLEPKKNSSENANKDTQPENLSNSTSNEKLEDTNDIEKTLESIKNDVIQLLALSNNRKKAEIIHDLLEHGRQSLVQYYDDLEPNIYQAAMSKSDSALLELLKRYFEQKWKSGYHSNKWFILFLNEYKNSENHDWYEQVLTRAARYGNKFTNYNTTLSVVLQFFFEGIDDNCFNGTNVFNELWLSVMNDGLKSITKYSDYIVEDVMNQLISKDPPVLFQAIREGCHSDLFRLLERCGIINKQNLYELALDNVAEHGWKIGLQAIEKKITPKHYKLLLEKVDVFLEERWRYAGWKKQGKEKFRYTPLK